MMQARWGSHGDYGIIALCPNSPQECFDLTITGFNLAEEFRVPVMMMLDECVGHMTEKVVIPRATRSRSRRAATPTSRPRSSASSSRTRTWSPTW
jgi:pyruvate/2-oxoacid:ferredoxin oxidoreductase alpha subunit